jgi:hypothetical protein
MKVKMKQQPMLISKMYQSPDTWQSRNGGQCRPKTAQPAHNVTTRAKRMGCPATAGQNLRTAGTGEQQELETAPKGPQAMQASSNLRVVCCPAC